MSQTGAYDSLRPPSLQYIGAGSTRVGIERNYTRYNPFRYILNGAAFLNIESGNTLFKHLSRNVLLCHCLFWVLFPPVAPSIEPNPRIRLRLLLISIRIHPGIRWAVCCIWWDLAPPLAPSLLPQDLKAMSDFCSLWTLLHFGFQTSVSIRYCHQDLTSDRCRRTLSDACLSSRSWDETSRSGREGGCAPPAGLGAHGFRLWLIYGIEEGDLTRFSVAPQQSIKFSYSASWAGRATYTVACKGTWRGREGRIAGGRRFNVWPRGGDYPLHDKEVHHKTFSGVCVARVRWICIATTVPESRGFWLCIRIRQITAMESGLRYWRMHGGFQRARGGVRWWTRRACGHAPDMGWLSDFTYQEAAPCDSMSHWRSGGCKNLAQGPSRQDFNILTSRPSTLGPGHPDSMPHPNSRSAACTSLPRFSLPSTSLGCVSVGLFQPISPLANKSSPRAEPRMRVLCRETRTYTTHCKTSFWGKPFLCTCAILSSVILLFGT